MPVKLPIVTGQGVTGWILPRRRAAALDISPSKLPNRMDERRLCLCGVFAPKARSKRRA